MWELLLTGEYSVPQIINIANNEWGYTTRATKSYPSHPLNRAAAYKMFTNPKYAGLIPVTGKPGEYVKSAYEPMVTLYEYDRAQIFLGKKGRPRFSGVKAFEYKGIMVCGECGCSITAEAKKVKLANGAEKHLVYYHCTRKRPCAQKKNIEERALEEQFGDILSRYQILPEFEAWALEAVRNMNQDEAKEREQIIQMQENSLADARRRHDRLIDLATTAALDEQTFIQKSRQLQEEIRQLENKIEATREQAENWRATFTETIDLIAHCRERFATGDNAVKRKIMSSLGSKCVLKEGIIELTPHPWLVPVERDYPRLEEQFEKVRSAKQQIRTAILQAVRISWRRRGDSNSRYRSPRTNDLANRPLQPLGYSSVFTVGGVLVCNSYVIANLGDGFRLLICVSRSSHLGTPTHCRLSREFS